MKRRVRVTRLRLWGFAAVVLVFVVVWAVAQRRAQLPGETGGAASVPTSAASSTAITPTASALGSSAAATAEKPASRSTRAEAGDLAALKEIERAEPSSRAEADVVALALGHRILRRNAVRELGRGIERQPGLAEDASTLRRLVGLARDPEVSIEALATIADLPGSVGPDLLFELWQEAAPGSANSLLSEDLLRSREVRSRASGALSLWLDLRDARSCIARRALMPRAIEHADERALPDLDALSERTGCGEALPGKAGGEEDCNPCLREGDWLARAIEAARERKAPIDRKLLERSH